MIGPGGFMAAPKAPEKSSELFLNNTKNKCRDCKILPGYEHEPWCLKRERNKSKKA